MVLLTLKIIIKKLIVKRVSVPDGDTGTNMQMTIMAGTNEPLILIANQS